MKIRSVCLEKVIGVSSKIPDMQLPEFAFAGRSNVGKSSLINSLMNRRSLARTSSQPGKTQTINYYNVNNELYFVDLPGYGYARASKTEKEKWGRMVERYLQGSSQLKRIYLLIDIRHEPSKADKQMYDWITANGFDPFIILTKLDKIKRSEKDKNIKLIKECLDIKENTGLIAFSSVSRQGREEIYEDIDQILEDND